MSDWPCMQGAQLYLRTEIEGIQRSSLDCGNINNSMWPRVLPAVCIHAGTEFPVGVCTSLTHSDLPSGFLFKVMSAFHSPPSLPSFDSSSRYMKTGIVVTSKLIRFCGLLPLWSHFCCIQKKKLRCSDVNRRDFKKWARRRI